MKIRTFHPDINKFCRVLFSGMSYGSFSEWPKNLSQNATFSSVLAEILGNSAAENDGLAESLWNEVFWKPLLHNSRLREEAAGQTWRIPQLEEPQAFSFSFDGYDNFDGTRRVGSQPPRECRGDLVWTFQFLREMLKSVRAPRQDALCCRGGT